MRSYLQGLIGFVVSALIGGALVLGYQQYRVAMMANKLLTGQCSAVEQSVIDAAVDRALEGNLAK